MNTKIGQALKAGIIATLVMTMIMFVAPYMGLPKMNPAAMLSMMMGVPAIIGWMMHFMIGVIFAFSYVMIFHSLLHRVTQKFIKGVIFGFIAFVIAQIALPVMGAIFGGMPSPEGGMALMMMGSLIGHVVFGIVVALLANVNN